MPTWLWRTLALSLIALALLDVGAAMLTRSTSLELAGTTATPQPGFDGLIVKSVRSGSEADRAGIRAGDVLLPRTPTFAGRVNFDFATAGQRVPVRIQSNGPVRNAELSVERVARPGGVALSLVDDVIRLAMLLVALGVTLIRPDRLDARLLVGFLTLFVLGAYGIPDTIAPPWLAFVATILAQLSILASLAQAAALATVFPIEHGGRGIRGAIARLNPWVFGSISVVVVVFSIVAEVTGAVPPWMKPSIFFCILAYCAAIIVAFTNGIRSSSGLEQERGRWLALSLAVGCSGVVLNILMQAVGRSDSPWLRYTPLTLAVMPIGLAYAILRHRVLDIRFAISRALALTILSGTIVAAFGALEWAIGAFLAESGHLTSAALQLALAVTLGLSLQPLHRAIDRIVDDVLFRERHRAVRALSSFAFEATFFTDASALIAATSALVGKACNAPCGIYFADQRRTFAASDSRPDDFPVAVDENDAAIVKMKAYREPITLSELQTAIAAEVAFPMIVRGVLTGFLAVGARAGEPIAPDEMTALATLATSVGNVVDGLRTDDLRAVVARALDGDLTGDELRAHLRLLDTPR